MANRKKAKIDWKLDGFVEARNDPRVHKKLEEIGQEIIKDASENGRIEGYVGEPRTLQRNRAGYTVFCFGEANNHNRKHNALIKALYKYKE